MPSPAASRNRLAPCPSDDSSREWPGTPLARRSRVLRLLLRLARGLGTEECAAVPLRVYYKFDAGCWRSRNTQQLHKVYRCR
jgi:hypothetical protein